MESPVLHRATAAQLALFRAALEWDLVDPIVIETRDDLKSEERWKDRVEPYRHQVDNLITFCRRLPVTLLADDVGLGKTISAGLVASELISRSRVRKILIVCPKMLGPQWREELDSKFGIPAEIAIGRDLLTADPQGDFGAVITTYASARLHLNSIPDDRFDMLILDEAHKLRNLYGTPSPPKVATQFRAALEARRFRYVLMLTATPIHNRLWDLYSLVDLLAVARGHPNPFGSEGMFARKFIADDVTQARRLKAEARDEFRSTVYKYMSRVRRGDADLQFPDRVVQLHKVPPTTGEVELISVLSEHIKTLNRLTQISLLQALMSSPDALSKQLNNMADNGTAPLELASSVRAIVECMPPIAKLQGLGALIDKLGRERPDDWRLLVFTTRRETQTTIQTFLEERGLRVGIINGSTGGRNQETIERFKQEPPYHHVIVSTEAGSEGLNLQAANVLVNFDLPWNPMIVEQRIGRVQRLASTHSSVCIFNIVLEGTFEEYIVARLLQKLQLASHAIGDIEALLEGSGIDDEDDEEAGFVERIRKLVVDSLEGIDVEEATRKAEESIEEAAKTLEREQQNIDSMLAGSGDVAQEGPPPPKLPLQKPALSAQEFTLAAKKISGARITSCAPGRFLIEGPQGTEIIRFEEAQESAAGDVLYAPGSPAFARLVTEVLSRSPYRVRELESATVAEHQKSLASMAGGWARKFGGRPTKLTVRAKRAIFSGNALARVRATVAHDSYERLVDVPCSGSHHNRPFDNATPHVLPESVSRVADVGVDLIRLTESAFADEAVSQFCTFYEARREEEVAAAGEDERKRQKLEQEFTPRLEGALVALEGVRGQQATLGVRYLLGQSVEYESLVTFEAHTGEVIQQPKFGRCAQTEQIVPEDALGQCDISGATVLMHMLVKSGVSGRKALSDHAVTCELSGQTLLVDEAERSALTGKWVASSLLETSAMSGKRAEPTHFGKCEFSGARVLVSELATSDLSGKRYRIDQECASFISGAKGHRQEFVQCSETKQAILPSEAGKCAVTGKIVLPALLEECEFTGKRVLPSELQRCAVSAKKVLRAELVTSSVSGCRLLASMAIQSVGGEFCAPLEARQCLWQGVATHPVDLRECQLTGLPIHFRFGTSSMPNNQPDEPARPSLKTLVELLDGTSRAAEMRGVWEEIGEKASSLIKGKCEAESARVSPSGNHIAVCLKVQRFLGLKTSYAGLVYSLADKAVVGRIVVGARDGKGWHLA